MAANVYECMFILDAHRYARDPGNVAGQIPAMIENCDGEVLASRLWNEQKLAYPIKGQRKGTYWLTYFRMDSSRLSEFNRACQLNDNVLRNLTLKVEDRLVDALVTHARGESTQADQTATDSDDQKAGADDAAATSSNKEQATASESSDS